MFGKLLAKFPRKPRKRISMDDIVRLSFVQVHPVGCSEAALQPAAWTLFFFMPLIKQSQSLNDQSVCV